MTDPEYFKKRLEILEKDKAVIRSKFNILLLGAFYPDHQFKRLKGIKSKLIEKGWDKTHMVCDSPKTYEGKKRGVQTIRERSFSAINDANAVVFIFTKGGQSDGRGMEVEHVFRTPYLLWKTIMIFEEDDHMIYGSEMIKDELKKIKGEVIIAYVPVEDDEYLIETIESHLENLIKDYPKISDNI